MKKTFIIPVLLLWFTLPACTQKLVATKTTIDVGRTGYQMPVTAVFEFKNKSKQRLTINEVKPDCRCVSVDYPHSSIAGGATFQIRMTYDARQLGHFNQQAAIISNDTKKPFYIMMQGVVLEHYVDLSKHYPVDMGDLRLDKNEIEFDDVNRGDRQVQQLRIYNNGTRIYQPYLMHLPPYLTATVTPERLVSGEEGVITVTLNSSKLYDYGLTQTNIFLAGNPGDKVNPDREIGVSAILLPAFPAPADQLRAPAIQLSDEVLNIDFEGKSKKTQVIDIVNSGTAELVISSLQMFTPGLRISLSQSRLLPGMTAHLKVTAYKDELLKARTRPRILMITNDSARPKVIIELTKPKK